MIKSTKNFIHENDGIIVRPLQFNPKRKIYQFSSSSGPQKSLTDNTLIKRPFTQNNTRQPNTTPYLINTQDNLIDSLSEIEKTDSLEDDSLRDLMNIHQLFSTKPTNEQFRITLNKPIKKPSILLRQAKSIHSHEESMFNRSTIRQPQIPMFQQSQQPQYIVKQNKLQHRLSTASNSIQQNYFLVNGKSIKNQISEHVNTVQPEQNKQFQRGSISIHKLFSGISPQKQLMYSRSGLRNRQY